MSINKKIPKENDILKDDNQLWYFTKEQKKQIIDYLESCSIDDLKDVSPMGEQYFIPTWYYFLNDYSIAKKLIEKENFTELLYLSPEQYKNFEGDNINEYGMPKKTITMLDTTLYFTTNNEVLLLLKKAGFQFKNNLFTLDNFYRTYEIIKAGVIEFNEEFLVENISSIGDDYNSILQKILFNYETKKDSKKDLLEMALSVNGFVELGCKTHIKYKKLISASEIFISETKNYKELIEIYCPELFLMMEKLEFIDRMENIKIRKEKKNKI